MNTRLAAIGIEIGGTKIQTATVDPTGVVLGSVRDRVDPAAGAEGIRAALGRQLLRVAADARAMGVVIRAAGIGFGGPVDRVRGIVATSFHVPGWAHFSLGPWVGETLEPLLGRIPVVLENDSNAAALGEALAGAGRGSRVVFYSNVGSGIGAGLVIAGALYRGRDCGEMELGHLRLSRDGGILEQSAAGWAIDGRVREAAADPTGRLASLASASGERPCARLLAPAIAAGDTVAQGILDEAARFYAHALAHVVQLLNPDVIVLGGGVASIGEAWRTSVERQIEPLLMTPFRPGPPVRLAALGEEVVPVGAALAAWETAGGSAIMP